MEFDFQKIFIERFNLQAALEILLRTIIIFLTVLAFLRLSRYRTGHEPSMMQVNEHPAWDRQKGNPATFAL